MPDGDLCPSAIGAPGARLIGITAGPGALGYVTPALPVDRDFLAAAGEEPEQRFRFANRCQQSGCHNWGENQCQLIHQILRRRPDDAVRAPLPACGIRQSCRWFAQAGPAACQACPGVRNPGATRTGATPGATNP